jgi:hypothetical protein
MIEDIHEGHIAGDSPEQLLGRFDYVTLAVPAEIALSQYRDGVLAKHRLPH